MLIDCDVHVGYDTLLDLLPFVPAIATLHEGCAES